MSEAIHFYEFGQKSTMYPLDNNLWKKYVGTNGTLSQGSLYNHLSNEEKRWCAIEESDCPFAHRAKTRPNAQCCMKIKFVEFESKRLIQKIEVARRMCMCRELRIMWPTIIKQIYTLPLHSGSLELGTITPMFD